jgi:uncharacterized membrane protein YedE/YeeE
MTPFTPLESFIGGLMIGAAAVMLMALHGRVAGMTGILSGLLPPAPASDWGWRAAFLAGMLASPTVFSLVTGRPVAIDISASAGALVLSGLIVGIGVTYGSGCPSGHGVCGLARLSMRSLVATLTFMATAFATVLVSRHLLGV